MKKSINTFLYFFFFSNSFFAQADLVISEASFEATSVDKGALFSVQATVSNVGNVAAAANYMFLYYSQDLTISDSEIISRVSIKALGPNESQEVDFLYPIPTTLAPGDYYIGLEVDPFEQIPESDEDNVFCAADGVDCATFQVSDMIQHQLKFTYPVLFIHGFSSYSETWNNFTTEAAQYYGWTYGGRLDYCLNPDDDQSTSDGSILSFADAANLDLGDYYYVNFDVSTDGEPFVANDGVPFNNDYSNQSAIVKQGWAMSDAIEKVLDLTGAEKVILVGHSMGGLASREYLQNPNNWQDDGAHHVAKLLTIGTPNGGSNLSGVGLGLFAGLDEASESVRDLRYSSFLFGGQYLDGGIESSFSIFHNNDVDCNGTTGDDIIGLNQKIAPSDISYACIVGVGNNLPSLQGDGVVNENRADLNNFLLSQPPLASLHADRFDVSSGHLSLHTENHASLIRGLDEPAFYEIAYPIPLNSTHFGHASEQAANNPIPAPNNDIDWDDFVIEVPENGFLEVTVQNIPVHDFALYLLDENYNILQEVVAEGESKIGFGYQIEAGTYYLEMGSIPTPNSWRFPYAYSVSFTGASELAADFSANVQEGCEALTVHFSNQSAGNPNNYAWTFNGGIPSTSSAANPVVTYDQAGLYPVSLTVSNLLGSNSVTQDGYITVGSVPEADFSFAFQANNTISFSNQTQFDLETPDYVWDFGDNQSSTAVSPSHTYQSDGLYTVTLTATNECGTSTTSQMIEIITVATEEVSSDHKISVSPNPARDIITLKLAGDYVGDYRIALINSIGQVLLQEKTTKSGPITEFQMDIRDLPGGTYFVLVTSNMDRWVLKVIKA